MEITVKPSNTTKNAEVSFKNVLILCDEGYIDERDNIKLCYRGMDLMEIQVTEPLLGINNAIRRAIRNGETKTFEVEE